jgi:copper(I)-binding protein
MKLIQSTIAAVAITLTTLAIADMPMISDMKVMAPPPGSKVTAGFLTINNISSDTLVVSAVSSAAIPRIEMHESVVKNDIASMVKQEQLSIPAGETLELKHGSYHLMLMDLDTTLTPGTTLSITLHTNQGDIELDMPVMKPGMSGGHKMGHDKHQKPKMMNHGEEDVGAPKPKMNH